MPLREPALLGSLLDPEGCQIEFVQPGVLRARKVVKRSNLRVTYKYPCLKEGRMTQCESSHELGCHKLLDACAGVSFSEQPAIISYIDAGVKKRHFPDLFVQAPFGKELWEVKEDLEAESMEVRYRTDLLIRRLPRLGYRYRLVRASQLSVPPFPENADFLLRFGRKPVSEIDRERVRLTFLRLGSINWDQIQAGVLGSLGRRWVCRLIIDGVLVCDMSRPQRGQKRISFNDSYDRSEPWVFRLLDANKS